MGVGFAGNDNLWIRVWRAPPSSPSFSSTAVGPTSPASSISLSGSALSSTRGLGEDLNTFHGASHFRSRGKRKSKEGGSGAYDVLDEIRGPLEIRCVRRDLLLRTLEEQLPKGTIRYNSRIVSIEEDGNIKILQLADGSLLRAKVLIGCDGINSVVTKWLGLAKPSYSGRSAARGLAHYPDGHGMEPKWLRFVGHGFKFGMMPCNETDIYWFFTWSPSEHDKGVDESAASMKQFVLDKLRGSKVPEETLAVVEKSDMGDVLAALLRFRPPLSLISASISKGNACVAGDALHPMTPDLGQGGCSALEDGVILARCLGEALLAAGKDAMGSSERIESGLREFARIRRWRSVELVATAYTLGFIQQSENAIISFLRDKFLSGVLACGTLSN